MGSRVLLESLHVGSTVRLDAAAAAASSSSSASSIFGVHQPGLWYKRSHRVTLNHRTSNGAVTAMISIQRSDDLKRNIFGRGSAAARSNRPQLQGQASKQTFSSFDDMIEKCEVPVLVDFYAVWCGPCQLMAPILNEVNGTLKDKIRIVKIDTEKYPKLASRFNINALPTMVLFQNGKPIDRVEGALKAGDLIDRIQQVLSVQANV